MSNDEGLRPETFEWDEAKNLKNIEKHGIRFADAVAVFDDPAAIAFASAGNHGETRFLIVGRMKGIVATVIFTVRDKRIRIISARRARTQERNRYDN